MHKCKFLNTSFKQKISKFTLRLVYLYKSFARQFAKKVESIGVSICIFRRIYMFQGSEISKNVFDVKNEESFWYKSNKMRRCCADIFFKLLLLFYFYNFSNSSMSKIDAHQTSDSVRSWHKLLLIKFRH